MDEKQIALLREWYQDVLAKADYFELASADQFLTVMMPTQKQAKVAAAD